MIGPKMAIMCSKLVISWLVIRTYGLFSTHSFFRTSFTKNLLVKPLSTLMPLTISVCVFVVRLFSTVTCDTLLYVSAIIAPNFASLLAEMVATSKSLLPLTGLDILTNCASIFSAMSLMCLMTSVVLVSSSISSSAALIIAPVRTTEVVVPSPAIVAVCEAA